MLEFNERLLDAMGHGEVDAPCVVVPFEVYATKQGSPPINQDFAMITTNVK